MGPYLLHNTLGWTDIHHATYKGDIAGIRRLVGKGTSVDTETNWSKDSGYGNASLTPLHIACLNKDLRIMKELVSLGGDLHKKTFSELFKFRKDEKIYGTTGSKRSDVLDITFGFIGNDFETKLMDILEFLGENGFDMTRPFNWNNDVGISSPATTHIEYLEFFLRNGANPDQYVKLYNKNDHRSIDSMNERGSVLFNTEDPDKIRLFRSYGADTSARSSMGMSLYRRYDIFGQNGNYNPDNDKLRALEEPVEMKVATKLKPGELVELRSEMEEIKSSLQTCLSDKLNISSDLSDKTEELSEERSKSFRKLLDLRSKVSRLETQVTVSGNDLMNCVQRKDELNGLLRDSEALLESRTRTMQECQENVEELNGDIAAISARLMIENSELSTDVNESTERLRQALEEASRNSSSVHLGSLVSDISNFMNSGSMNDYQLALLETVMENNVRQATTSEKVDVLRSIFESIRDRVRDRRSSLQILDELESKDFKVGLLTKIGAHMRLF